MNKGGIGNRYKSSKFEHNWSRKSLKSELLFLSFCLFTEDKTNDDC